ncbi:armadillo repeat-containing protein 3 isoform X1 [Takifugu flavidus]|nr:armadillo repeat-containing protein 3 isoform X1 [Takifugu flavidus]
MSNRRTEMKVTKEIDSSTNEMAQFSPLHIESKTAATAVLLLNSVEEHILVKACNGIRIFAEKGEENKVSLVGLGALDPLCQLIAHSNVLVRRKAIITLGTMATSSEVKNALKEIEVIPSIVDSLSLEDVVVHEFATLCLASLSVDYDFKAKIIDSKGLPPLVQLLSSPDNDVQKNSLEVIYNLVQDQETSQEVHKLGVLHSLLDLLKSEFPVIQHLALKTLQYITTEEKTLITFREQQGLEKLMDILSNADFTDLHVEALQVFFNCLSDSESEQEIHQNGGLERLIEFILTSTEPEIHFIAIKCITRVAEKSDSPKLKKHNVEEILVNLLSAAEDNIVKAAICEAVKVMSPNQASKDCFRDRGAIPEIVKLLNSENVGLKEEATRALCGLTNSSNLNALAVFEAGGHKKLISQLCGGGPAIVANSAAALCNMAEQKVIRCSILSHGGIQALVEPLNSTSTQVLVNTLHCLLALACETKTRTQLQSAGGLQPLVNLLRSNDKEVLQNACIAIKTFASDEPTAAQIYQLGAMEMLQDINQSQNRRSRFSKMALITLLNFNLPVKYALMGHLASTDKITDGFYDVGKVQAVDKILTLEELSKQPVNNRRPIIFINSGVGRKPVTINEGREDASPEMPTSNKKSQKTPKKPVTKYEGREDASPEISTSKTSQKTPKKKKEDNSPKDMVFPLSPKDTPWEMKDDTTLQGLVKEVEESILSLDDEREKFAALARLVSEVMGGEVQMEKLHEFPWGLHLSELKVELQSNLIPIGLVRYGFFCHRALLFKFLADSIRLNCTLNRGEYNRAWNEVLLSPGDSSNDASSSEPAGYIVDLMHQPGRMLAVNTPATVQYQSI